MYLDAHVKYPLFLSDNNNNNIIIIIIITYNILYYNIFS